MASPGHRRGHSVAPRRRARGGQSALRRSVPNDRQTISSFEEEEEEGGEDHGAAGHRRSRDVDATLLFASLDSEVAVEDEAEAVSTSLSVIYSCDTRLRIFSLPTPVDVCGFLRLF